VWSGEQRGGQKRGVKFVENNKQTHTHQLITSTRVPAASRASPKRFGVAVGGGGRPRLHAIGRSPSPPLLNPSILSVRLQPLGLLPLLHFALTGPNLLLLPTGTAELLTTAAVEEANQNVNNTVAPGRKERTQKKFTARGPREWRWGGGPVQINSFTFPLLFFPFSHLCEMI